jgi:ribose transport system substrate-binding protein
MRRRMKFLLVFALLAALVAGCGGGGGGGGKVTIGLALSTLQNPFFVTIRDAARQAASSGDATLQISDGRDDANKQANDVQDMITRGVDVLIINPVDSDAIVNSVESANDADIPVITVDRASNGGGVASHIASDNVAGGREAANFLFKQLGAKGRVAELEGIPGTSAARDRGKGFEEALPNASGIKLVSKQTANFDRNQGFSVAQNIFEANPDLAGLFAQNDEMALGAVRAAKQGGKTVKIMGFDAIPDAITAIMAGDMIGTIAQQPALMGKRSVETAIKIANDESVPKNQPVPIKLVTKANAAQFGG